MRARLDVAYPSAKYANDFARASLAGEPVVFPAAMKRSSAAMAFAALRA